jgi:hypothetical protein
MKFLLRPSRPPDPARSRARAVDAWNTAAGRVWSRWDAFLAAPEARRHRAYEAYLAALDAEEAAAQRVADIGVSMAA